MSSVVWHRLAVLELNEAAGFLTSERRSLGEGLLHEAERCVPGIAEQPGAGQLIGTSVRRRILRRFPYAVLYHDAGSEIRILAVMHLRRRPSYWLDRLDQDLNTSQ